MSHLSRLSLIAIRGTIPTGIAITPATGRLSTLHPSVYVICHLSNLIWYEIAKRYLEEDVWAKAFITYLDAVSTDPRKGA